MPSKWKIRIDLSKITSENTRVAWADVTQMYSWWYKQVILDVSINRAKQNACKDLFKVDSQKSKAMDGNALSSKLTNLDRLVSNTNKECQTINVLRSMYQTFPEISDISDKYGNLLLMSSLSVLHEDKIKTSLSQQINKLTRCYYAMSML